MLPAVRPRQTLARKGPDLAPDRVGSRGNRPVKKVAKHQRDKRRHHAEHSDEHCPPADGSSPRGVQRQLHPQANIFCLFLRNKGRAGPQPDNDATEGQHTTHCHGPPQLVRGEDEDAAGEQRREQRDEGWSADAQALQWLRIDGAGNQHLAFPFLGVRQVKAAFVDMAHKVRLVP